VEKIGYRIILFLLLSLAIIDLTLVIMVTFYGVHFPQLQPFQWMISLSFLTVTGFLLLAWKKYREEFPSGSKNQVP